MASASNTNNNESWGWGYGWPLALLPMMEQQPLFNAFNFSRGFFETGNVNNTCNSTVCYTNIASLNDTISNLTEAESKIRDADFAAETAKLTRAQILVQSGTAVLQIANKNPQNVLALLQ